MHGGAPPPGLPVAAHAAWYAYDAMEASKAAHLDELTRQHEARRHGAPAHTLAATAHLAALLEAHDARVRAFAAAMRDLAQRDASAHRALVAYLTTRNEASGQVTH